MAQEGLQLRIITPERVLFDEAVDAVTATAWDGELGILPRHAPMIALLGIGPFRAKRGGSYQYFAVHEGFLHVADGVVTVLAAAAESAEELEADQARLAQMVRSSDSLLQSTIPGDEERKRLLREKARRKVVARA
ncbi:MAG: ATP synthase F1 subunit epsilon [Gemmatimonadetes bacterium]|nr:ATP synthase F1 subunit epsilon [Gemmatimonadota bacterium]